MHDAFREKATVVINPAGFSFRSVPLLDALHMLARPIVEVHITNIHARDAVHQHSLISSVARVVIAGAGVYGYELAIRAADRLTARPAVDRWPRELTASGQPRAIASAASIPNTSALVSAVPVMYEARGSLRRPRRRRRARRCGVRRRA